MIFFIMSSLCALVPMGVGYASLSARIFSGHDIEPEWTFLSGSFLALAAYWTALGCLWEVL